MALNKYMHPRNIYKTPPNFEKLSKEYEEFSKVAKMDISGKVMINFKDPNALRVLTKCLLKSDFKLDVDIPEDRLVPTLPLRLNYILWLEDLMNAIERKTEVRGIDIGTGACAIYPLLAAVKNKWQMLGTEADTVSLQKAQENVNRNNLQTHIQLKINKDSTLIQHLFTENDGRTFDFCMCNPPFYSNIQELYESRSPARLPPKNGFTGSPQELITEGGELEFCRKLIKESINCKDKVLIFTTMIGHKYHMSELQQDLKAQNIKHTTTEFCQGRVTRWGLAWTFQDYDIYKLVPPREKSRKKTVPILFQLTETPDCEYKLHAVFNKIKNLLNTLNIEHKIINKRGNNICLDVIARVNTWSNQRKRRRLIQRGETETKKIKVENSESFNKNVECPNTGGENGESSSSNVENSNKNGESFGSRENEETSVKTGENIAETETHKNELENENNSRELVESSAKSTKSLDTSESDKNNPITLKKQSIEETEEMAEKEPLVQAFFKLFKKEEAIFLEMECVGGSGGKESLHQIMQYIKNNWK